MSVHPAYRQHQVRQLIERGPGIVLAALAQVEGGTPLDVALEALTGPSHADYAASGSDLLPIDRNHSGAAPRLKLFQGGRQ